ncbi:hypothetical protein O3P69_008636 [Scylla paramamosain]|uniref:CDK-activating kinase assembly factor MAT1 n=1 Tax=Scylla paramamosain TaxID=85552 RepID=A0AAW0SM35_SCYPA
MKYQDITITTVPPNTHTHNQNTTAATTRNPSLNSFTGIYIRMGDYYDASYETQCPQCRSTKYRNPQMKLMVNVCGHPMCDSCVRMYFIKESAPCPECEIILKRSKFRVQIYEDPLVEKELAIRRKVMKVYNMSEDDFPTLEEWNAYLEEIEEIVYNITNDINKPEMEKKIENYEKQNKNEIRKKLWQKEPL